ncbi:hypothetical protein CYLTODRAFT_460543 [Cylindrobasidium torrendii FP15055 ss-10]|uniref:Uncharacterized protein n=1 Tax=Cylindrobasidium torrendii FP15055 ss-10 TaxID=1314674 RepID=A0A0D7AR42_9AGAR|nr:hypothetical protein CYLTODRAFT_460543 [Cylindrobasidium torrendii FP15055 ss-10]
MSDLNMTPEMQQMLFRMMQQTFGMGGIMSPSLSVSPAPSQQPMPPASSQPMVPAPSQSIPLAPSQPIPLAPSQPVLNPPNTTGTMHPTSSQPSESLPTPLQSMFNPPNPMARFQQSLASLSVASIRSHTKPSLLAEVHEALDQYDLEAGPVQCQLRSLHPPLQLGTVYLDEAFVSELLFSHL